MTKLAKSLTSVAGILLALTFITASETAAQNTTFLYQEGQYLYDVWESPVVRQAYPDWSVYWKETCELNPNIQCTDEAWRNISPGTPITLPNISTASAASSEELATLRQENESLRMEVAGLRSDSVEQAAILEVERQRLAEARGSPVWLAWVLGILLLVALAVLVLQYGFDRVRERELMNARNKNLWLQSAARFAEDVSIEVPVPSGFMHVYGENTVRFLRGPEVDGEKTLIIRGMNDPVKIKNFERRLNNALNEVLLTNELIREQREPVELSKSENGTQKYEDERDVTHTVLMPQGRR